MIPNSKIRKDTKRLVIPFYPITLDGRRGTADKFVTLPFL